MTEKEQNKSAKPQFLLRQLELTPAVNGTEPGRFQGGRAFPHTKGTDRGSFQGGVTYIQKQPLTATH